MSSTAPRAPSSEALSVSLRDLRRFHHSGPTADRPGLPGDHGFRPWALAPFLGRAGLRTDYPLWLEEGGGHRVLGLEQALAAVAAAFEGERLLDDNLQRIELGVRELMAESPGPRDGRELLAAAMARAGERMGLPSDERARWKELEGGLVTTLPEGRFHPLSPEIVAELLAHAGRAAQRRSRAGLEAQVREGIPLLAGLLGDRAKDGSQEATTLGEVGGRFVNPARLAEIACPARVEATLDADRRQRLGVELDALEDRLAESPLPILVHDGTTTDGWELDGWSVVSADDPCRRAMREFDDAAAATALAVRALRLARLLTESRYEPARHDPLLEQLDWRGFTAEERTLLPLVAVVVGEAWLAGPGLGSLSELLRSGRPVQVVALLDPGAQAGSEGYRFEAGYLGLAHREAFVAQLSAARPLHLAAGGRASLVSQRSALLVVAGARAGAVAEEEWLRLSAGLEGRAQPLLVYDPEAGTSWARRLDFQGNPDPEALWPQEAAEEGGEAVAFTFADYALLEPAWSGHFLEVPEDLPERELEPFSDWLELAGPEAAARPPYVRARGPSRGDRRLVVSRRLALAARDRASYWRTLQELAGVRSEYTERAVREVTERLEAEATKDRETREERHRRDLERVRTQAVREAADRMTAALLDVDLATLMATPPGPSTGLPTGSVDELAEALLGLVSAAPATPSDDEDQEAVESVARRLMEMAAEPDSDLDEEPPP